MYNFPVTIYSEVEKFNDVLSKARCRIFYRYENRNGTFISDDFARQLIASLAYVPIKGIYQEEDFTDHGYARDEGRIYGIVPETSNFAWEKHIDEDGIEREYACCDVLLFSALYSEASEIVGKSLSMELYEPSLKYHMAIIKGQKYVVFDSGCFLGLQVLGDNVEPCFEGASFYTLINTIEDTIQKIKDYSKGGQSKVFKLNFKLSDGDKHDALWMLLNPLYNAENDWVCSYAITEVYDEYAIAYNYETRNFERVYYKKNDEEDSVEILSKEVVYFIDVTEKEKETVETLRKLNGDTYELVNENLLNAETVAADYEARGLKIDELNEQISTLNTEAENMNSQLEEASQKYTALTASYDELNTEVEGLRNYKKVIETQQKQAVIAEYSDKISEDVLNTYAEKIDEYTALELDKELAYELKKSNSFAFAADPIGIVPKDQSIGGIEEILSRYNKK